MSIIIVDNFVIREIGFSGVYQISELVFGNQPNEVGEWEDRGTFEIIHHMGDNALKVDGVIHRLSDGGCWKGNEPSAPTPEEAFQWIKMNKII